MFAGCCSPKTGRGIRQIGQLLGTLGIYLHQLKFLQIDNALDFPDSDKKLVQINKTINHRGVVVLTAFIILNPALSVPAQSRGDAVTPAVATNQDQIIDYPGSFSGLFKPTTALDMVKQVSGLRLDDGVDIRSDSATGNNMSIEQISIAGFTQASSSRCLSVGAVSCGSRGGAGYGRRSIDSGHEWELLN